MTQSSSILDPDCLEQTANLLFQFFGNQAPVLARRCASDLRRKGQDEVANEWELVSLRALALIETPDHWAYCQNSGEFN